MSKCEEGDDVPFLVSVNYQWVMISAGNIEHVVNQKLEGTDCFLVDVEVKGNNTIFVYVDSDTGITVDRCGELNRYLEEKLDRNIEDFSLEVSSPGIGSPLKVFRQYSKCLGKQVAVTMLDGKQSKGILLSASPMLLELKNDAGKIELIDFSNVKTTKEILSF